MALGSMSYSEARTCAANLGTEADNMDATFNELRAEMNSLEDVLRSKGATALYESYLAVEKNLSSFSTKVRSFTDFLNAAVTEYERDDEQLASEAS